MNKSDLVSKIAEKMEISLTQAEQIISAFLDGISETLKGGDSVSLIGFGKFGVKERAARKVKNPRTGAEMQVEAKNVPFFKAGKELKEVVDS